MKTRVTPLLFALGVLVALFILHPSSSILSQGTLTPPGAPAPTMKTLDQIEPRTPISALPFTISAPGSYFLTGNLTASADGAAITVSADNVTIDLGGFTLAGGATGTRTGINVPAAQKALCVRNGTLTGWTNGAIAGGSVSGGVYENLRLTANSTASALQAGSNASVRACTATGNTTGTAAAITLGFYSLLSDCVASSNSYDGIQANGYCTIVNSTANSNGNTGIVGGFGNCAISNCTTNINGSNGMFVGAQCSIVNCTVSYNSINPGGTAGIYAGSESTLADCTLVSNDKQGIQVNNGCTIRHCTIASCGSTGLSVLGRCHVTGCTIEANNAFNSAGQAGMTTQGPGNHIDSCTFSYNKGAGLLSTGTSVTCTVNQCTFSNQTKSGLIIGTNCHVTGCTFETNNTFNTAGEAGLVVTGSGNRIDGNFFTNNNYAGMVANAAGGNMIVRNFFRGGQFYTHANNTLGPFVDTTAAGGTISSTNPWANFGY